MDLKLYLAQLTPQKYGDLTVDDTVGGVGFPAADLSWNRVEAKVVRVTVEGGNFRAKEVAGAPTSESGAIYHAAAPGGNPIYVKFGLDGTPYLCSNLATAGADKAVSFGAYKLVIKHDAGAATGLPLYFDYDATQPLRFLVNNTIYGKDVYAFSNDPTFMLVLKHDANAATNGVAVNYDDGADNRLEYISPGAVNATQDLATSGPNWGYQDAGNNEGQIYKQGGYGSSKFMAGGYWSMGVRCGPRCRSLDSYPWYPSVAVGARGCAEPR